jgi:ribosomal protein S27AE
LADAQPDAATRRDRKEQIMRFLNISGPGVAQDEDFCPNCHVLLDDRDDYKACPLCQYDTRQGVRQRRVQMRRR